MKATLKPTDKPGVFGIAIEDMTAEEATDMLHRLACFNGQTSATQVGLDNYSFLRPVLNDGIAAVKKGEE